MRDSDKIAIQEMTRIMCKPPSPFETDTPGDIFNGCYLAVMFAEKLYLAGCRKQRTAEWVTTTETEDGLIVRYTHRCTDCNYFYKTVCPRGDDYCHKCGAKMKGGE